MTNLKFKSYIFKSSSFCYSFLYIFSFIEKCLKPYQPNIIKKLKKQYELELVKYIYIFLRSYRYKFRDIVVVIVTKISQKMKKKRK